MATLFKNLTRLSVTGQLCVRDILTVGAAAAAFSHCGDATRVTTGHFQVLLLLLSLLSKMLANQFFFSILASCLVGCVVCRRRRVVQQVDDNIFSQNLQQQAQMNSPDYAWIPQQQLTQTSGLEFSNVYSQSEQNAQQQLQQSLVYQEPTNDCIINYDQVSSRYHHPMVVRSGEKTFLYPTLEGKSRFFRIDSKKSIIVACPGPENMLLLNSLSRAYITCKKRQLYYGRQAVTWSQLGCRRKPRPTLEKGGPCRSSFRTGSTYTILWPIRRGVSVPQISLCFDEVQETVLFTHHLIHGRNMDAKVIESSRPSFKREKMFTVSANLAYSKREEKALFSRLLGSDQYLTGKRQHYLARGHLTPDSDFILEAEQDATYYFANAVPQWQAVNNGNWKSLENSVRDLAEDHHRTLEIWTGVHEILHLPDARNDPVELFLGLSFEKKVIPVPALMWKVVHDPVAKRAIAIVQVNDVIGKGSTDSLTLHEPPCHDLCPEVPWVDWNVRDSTKGRTFCCSMQDLKRTIPGLPDLGPVGLLRSK